MTENRDLKKKVEELEKRLARVEKFLGSIETVKQTRANKKMQDLYEQAVRIVVEAGFASTALLQRRLAVGYIRAAHILSQMDTDGIVGPAQGSKPRRVLIKDADRFLRSQKHN